MDVEHPKDARTNDADPPCTICGQCESKHPKVEGFHLYSPPTAAAAAVPFAAPSLPAPADDDPPPTS
jgi:hypothetical protein